MKKGGYEERRGRERKARRRKREETRGKKYCIDGEGKKKTRNEGRRVGRGKRKGKEKKQKMERDEKKTPEDHIPLKRKRAGGQKNENKTE